MIIISVIAMLLALKPNDTILGIVAYAWGGLGAYWVVYIATGGFGAF